MGSEKLLPVPSVPPKSCTPYSQSQIPPNSRNHAPCIDVPQAQNHVPSTLDTTDFYQKCNKKVE